VGVVWDEEFAIKAYWEIRGDMPGPDSVLLGSAAGAALGAGEGDRVALGGRSLRVAGVLGETGGDDDNVIFVDLPLLQRLTGRAGEADFLEVAALCSACPIDDIVNELKDALPGREVLALRQVAESRMYSVHFAQNLTFSISLVILITACATVFMAMLSAVNERRKEIGIMRSVGFSRRHIFSVFALEALLIGLAAGALGFVLGHAVAGYVLENLHMTDDFAPAFQWGHFVLTSLGVGGLVIAASAFPAWKASRVEPAEVLAV
jgi:putative ABC transport system permease protein